MSGLAQNPAAWLIGAYLIAAVPVGVLIARLKGVDLRSVGSGNIGATNAVRALGRGWGLPVFALDVLKAALPVWFASRSPALLARDDGEWWIAAVGLAAVLGHIFPVYLRFRGGKGVACALGVFAALDPLAATGALVLYLQTLVLTRVSAVGSLTGVTALTVFVLLAERPMPLQVLAVSMAVLIWVRHRSNLQKLIADGRSRAAGERASTQAQVDATSAESDR